MENLSVITVTIDLNVKDMDKVKDDIRQAVDRVTEFPPEVTGDKGEWRDRSMLVVKAQRVDFECVVRGYIAGSLWKEYTQARGQNPGAPVELHGYTFPPDLEESQKLPEPIFTPATKAETGHDINISFSETERIVGADMAARLRAKTLEL